MAFYEKHMFICTNEKETGKCCQDANAKKILEYAKELSLELGLKRGKDGFRISGSGCMGRCASGPCIVIYPEGVWYTYSSKEDVKDIIKSHFIEGKIATEQLLK